MVSRWVSCFSFFCWMVLNLFCSQDPSLTIEAPMAVEDDLSRFGPQPGGQVDPFFLDFGPQPGTNFPLRFISTPVPNANFDGLEILPLWFLVDCPLGGLYFSRNTNLVKRDSRSLDVFFFLSSRSVLGMGNQQIDDLAAFGPQPGSFFSIDGFPQPGSGANIYLQATTTEPTSPDQPPQKQEDTKMRESNKPHAVMLTLFPKVHPNPLPSFA